MINEHLFYDSNLFEFYRKAYSRVYINRIIYNRLTGIPQTYDPNFFFNLDIFGTKPFFTDSIIRTLSSHNEECTLGTSAEGYSSIKLFYNEKTICYYDLIHLRVLLEKVVFFAIQREYIIDIKSENELYNYALYLSSQRKKNPYKEEIIMELVKEVWSNKENYSPTIDKRQSIVSEDFYSNIPNFNPKNKPQYIMAELNRLKGKSNRQIIMEYLPDVISTMEKNNQVINYTTISKELLSSMEMYKNVDSIRHIIRDIMEEENERYHLLDITEREYYTKNVQLMIPNRKPAPALDKMKLTINNLLMEKNIINQEILIKSGLSKITVKRNYKLFKEKIMEHNEKLNEEKKVKVLPDLRSEEQKIMEKKLETELAGTPRVSYNAKQQVLYKHWMNIHYQVINLNDKHQREIWKGYFGKMQNTLNLTSNMTINEFYKCLNWYKSIGFTGQDLALMLDDALAKADKNVKIDTSAALSSHLLNYERTGTGFLGHNNR